MARMRWLPICVVMLLFATLPAWSQCIVTGTQALNAAIEGACAIITLGGDIQLTGDVAPIDRNLTLDGGGFAINGGNQFQGLRVTGGTVSLSDLTVNGAVAQGGSGGSGMGGGLYVGVGAAVITDNVSLTNNEAAGGAGGGGGYGGGIYDAGSLTGTGALTVTGDKALGGGGGTGATGGNASGGGIYLASGGTLTVSNVTLGDNAATGGSGGTDATGGSGLGGAIYNESGGTATIGDATLSGNAATGGSGGTGATGGSGLGGAIYNQSGGTLTLSDVTLTGNAATGGAGGAGGSGGDGYGGGIYTEQGGGVGLSGADTLSGNQAVGGAGGGGSGSGKSGAGGMLILTGNVILSPSATVNQTVAGPIAGGGGLTKNGAGVLTLSGTNTYTGPTTVDDGILRLQNSGALGPGEATVASGAALDVGQTIQTVGGLNLSGAFAITLDGVAAGDYGALGATGTVTIDGGALDVIVCEACFALSVGDQFDIMSFAVLSGDFSAFSFDGGSCVWSPSSSGGSADCGGGLEFLLSEAPGTPLDNFYRLEITGVASVPEPGTLPLFASAIFILFLMRRMSPQSWRNS